MEAKTSIIEPLIEKAEQYGKTSFELVKIKSINKTSDVLTNLIFRLLSVAIFSLFLLVSTVALALFLGKLLGENYYGFLVISSFYAFLYFVLFLLKPMIKKQVKQSIVAQIYN